MTAVQGKQDLYFQHFAGLSKDRADREPSWLGDIRRAAIDRFGDLGFPTTHHEEWRFTSVAKLARTQFVPARTRLGSSDEDLAQRVIERSQPWMLTAAAECYRLFFLNGRFLPAWSSPAAPAAGVRAGSLAQTGFGNVARRDWATAPATLRDGALTLEAHLARHAGYEDHAFVALNTALFEDGALVEVRPDTVVDKPIVLMFVTVPEREPHMTHPRNLVLVGAGAQASLVEAHIGITGHPYLNNAVTELVAGANAVVDYTRIQDEDQSGYHIGVLQVEQARSSSVATHTISLGASIDREETRAVLNGEGAEGLLHGLYVIGGHQHVDNHTLIDHAKPHCSSREVYKGVLDGHAGGVFNGKIAVRKDAQKTDSKQSNKNLLLSEDATINTKPQLEIFADDVKCTHGATIGQIDAEAVFYLRSRGIGHQEARNLLIEAFANDILDRIKFQPLRASLQQTLGARLQLGRSVQSGSQESERTSHMEDAG